jgi:hypothetical protein
MAGFKTYGLAVVCAALASAAVAAHAPASARPTLAPQAAVTGYCAAWNTTDAKERDDLLARVWAKDGVYSDPEPTLAVGRKALSDAIVVFHHSYPGAYFRCSAPQAHHRWMRVTWIALKPDGKELTHGVDFYDMAPDGRIQRVVGFFGDPPKP